MAGSEELQKLTEEVASLRRIVAGMHRMGTVKKADNGKQEVRFAKGDIGDGDGDMTMPMIRTGHGGAVSEDRQYADGETVHIFCAGGNPEHAMIAPGGFNDDHPQDKNSTAKNTTRRWRKPPQEDQESESGSAGTKAGGEGTFGKDDRKGQKWKDSDDDHQEITDHERRWHKIGETEYTVTKDGGEIKHGDRKVKVDKDSVTLSQGDATLTMKGGKITLKGTDIVLDGKVHLGGEGGKKVAIVGTLDTKGDALVDTATATMVTAK